MGRPHADHTQAVSIGTMNATLVERGPQFFTDGPVTVVIGKDTAVTQWEILGHMSADRLALDSLTRSLQLLELQGTFPGEAVASVFVADQGDTAGVVGTAAFPVEPPAIPAIRLLILEAMAGVWTSRIQDIADATPPLNQNAVEELGRLDIPGTPLLNDLLAQRRRDPLGEGSEVRELINLVHDLRQRVVFGAAGFTAADPNLLAQNTAKALAPDGWMHRLTLLIAAQECLAAVLLAQLRGMEPTAESASELATVGNLILGNRAEDVRLAQLLQETLDLLSDPVLRDTGIVQKVLRKSPLKMLDGAIHIIRPFVELRKKTDTTTPGELTLGAPHTPHTPHTPGTREEIYDAELVADFNPEALADALGELFGKMLPDAQEYVNKLRTDHPTDTAQQREQRAGRRFLDLAAGRTEDPRHGALGLDEAVALHAMTLAVLREVPVNDPDKRARQAKQLQLMITGLDKLQEIPDNRLAQQGISAAQRAVFAFVLGRSGAGVNFPRVAVVANFVEKFVPTLDERLVAEKALSVVNIGVLKLIATMIGKSIT